MAKTILFLFSFIFSAFTAWSQDTIQSNAEETIKKVFNQEKKYFIYEKAELSFDGKYMVISLSEYSYLIIYDLKSEKIKQVIDYGLKIPIFNARNYFVLHPYKNELLVCATFETYSKIETWDLETGLKSNSIDILGELQSFNISNNGKFIAASMFGEPPLIRIIDYKSGNILYETYGSNAAINFSKDDKYIAGYIEEDPFDGGKKELILWDFQVDTFGLWWYIYEPSASFSLDGKTLKFGSYNESGFTSDAHYQPINYVKGKLIDKLIQPHIYYDKIKGETHIQNTGKYCYLLNTKGKKKKIKIEKIYKSLDPDKIDYSSLDFGAYDFSLDAKHIIFPCFYKENNEIVLSFFNLYKNKLEKTSPLKFQNTKYSIASNEFDFSSDYKLKIDEEFIIANNSFNYDEHINRSNEITRLEYFKIFTQIADKYEALESTFDKYYLLKCYNNLAGLYEYAGNYKKTDEFYDKMVLIVNANYSNNFPILRDLYIDLSYFYSRLNNYNKYEEYAQKLIKLIESKSCENTYEYALAFEDLAISQMKKREGSLIKADSLLNIAQNLYDKLDYNQTEVYFQILSLKGEICRKSIIPKNTKQQNKDLFNKANDYYSRVKYKIYANNGSLLNSKALLYLKAPYIFSNTDTISFYLDQASTASSEATDIYEYAYSEQHEDYMQSLYNEAISNYVNSCFSKNNKIDYLTLAGGKFQESVNSRINYFFNNLSFMSEKDATDFLMEEMDNLKDAFLSLANEYKEDPKLLESVYDFSLKTKSLLLKSSTAMRNSVLTSGDTALINDFNKWLEIKQLLSKLYAIPRDARPSDFYKTEKKANELESQLVKKSTLFNELNKLQDISWKQVRDSLKDGEAAIEFLRYNKFNPCIPEFTDSIIYCASLITKNSKYPELITLFNEKQLEEIIGKFGGNNYSYINSIYGKNTEVNTELYSLIWKPLEESLKGVKKVYISPDGLLHKISFSAIAKDQNVYLCDVYKLEVKSSTGKIIGRVDSGSSGGVKTIHESSQPTTATLFGGINYNTDSTTYQGWKYLEGTKTETQEINKILKKGKVEVNYFSNTSASEDEFKLMASNSHILHIATHGFFYPDPKEIEKQEEENTEVGEIIFRGGSRGFGVNSFVENQNPLMRSGLVFAGANDVWSKQAKNDSIDDGVLTAQEVANIDMRKTDLVVMSACETGLGDIKGSEGVYGLQRAFKMAGVDYLIMSLWQVPDKETEEFMTIFYKKLIKQNDIKTAFNQTQKEMRAKYDPYFWGAFMLIE